MADVVGAKLPGLLNRVEKALPGEG